MISQNSVHDNGQLGIDLGGDGVTLNGSHAFGQPGPNNWQRYPDMGIQVFPIGGELFILDARGTLYANSPGIYTIELFANPSIDPSGFGEGARFLGSASFRVTSVPGDHRILFDSRASESGFAIFFPLHPGEVATATITGPDGTSEFTQQLPQTISPFVSSVATSASLAAGLSSAPAGTTGGTAAPASAADPALSVSSNSVQDPLTSGPASVAMATAFAQRDNGSSSVADLDHLFATWGNAPSLWQNPADPGLL